VISDLTNFWVKVQLTKHTHTHTHTETDRLTLTLLETELILWE